MNEKFEAKLLYLKRLLNVYLLFIPYDSVEVSVESDSDRCYVRVQFYKHITLQDDFGKKNSIVNRSETKFTINELGKLIYFYKLNLRKKFKNRHTVSKSYDIFG